MRVTGTRGLLARALPAVLLVGFALGACSDDDDEARGTLDTIGAGPSPSGSAAPGQSGTTPPAGSAVDGPRGAGFVAIDVRITSVGIAETLSLDRSTVAQAALDPVTLDAMCTPLDGGDPAGGVVVSVVDLARLAGSQIVSAVLRYPDPAPGEHDMTLELGRADQSTASFSGTVTVGADGMSGSFDGTDGGATSVSGGFTCATEATVVTTTTVPLDIGEEVPEDSGLTIPTVTLPAVTVPAVTLPGG